jgi:hypothetical protein
VPVVLRWIKHDLNALFGNVHNVCLSSYKLDLDITKRDNVILSHQINNFETMLKSIVTIESNFMLKLARPYNNSVDLALYLAHRYLKLLACFKVTLRDNMSSTLNIDSIVSFISRQSTDRVTVALALANVLGGALSALTCTYAFSALIVETPSLTNLVVRAIWLFIRTGTFVTALSCDKRKLNKRRFASSAIFTLALDFTANAHARGAVIILAPCFTIFKSLLNAEFVLFDTEVWSAALILWAFVVLGIFDE